jgi:hypothetical protein
MSSEVFVISAAQGTDESQALRQALEMAGIKPSRVQDVVFGVEGSASTADPMAAVRAAGLTCPAVSVSPSLRAVFFAATSILSRDSELTVAVGMSGEGSAALVLGGPEAVGRWNLMPRARIAERSLAGAEAALRRAGLTTGEVTVTKTGNSIGLVNAVVQELERGEEPWGMVAAGKLALLLQRV